MKTLRHYLKLRHAVVFAVSLGALVAHAATDLYHADSIPVERFYSTTPDQYGLPRYTEENGTLYANGSYIVSSKTVYYCDNDPGYTYLSEADVASVSQACVMKLNIWITLNGSIDYLGLFSRLAPTYSLAGVPYVVVTAKSTGTAPAVNGSGPRFLNMSVRAIVPLNGSIIPGFVVADTPNHDKLQILVRAIGPTLASYGVGGTLGDPRLTIYDRDGHVIATNDDWELGDKPGILAAVAKVGAFPLASGTKDAALALTLAPGLYTASISGPTGTTGEVMLEVYGIN